MDEKREKILERVLHLFGKSAEKKKEEIIAKLKNIPEIDYFELTDEVIKHIFNDLVYDSNTFDKYIIPPFSTFDTRQGYWKERRNFWLQITGNLTETKENVLANTLMAQINQGSSNFDPVLAEVILRWFNIANGKVLDPFGGEQTKGVVCGVLKMPYWGCEIRPDQVLLNKEKTKDFANISYICGDSNDIGNLIGERDFDLVFTSPPYYDLEIYSETDMSALPTYDEFMTQLKNIYTQCVAMLASDRFFVIKVGEIRDKKGIYRNFVGDTIKILLDLGLHYYNEIILINSVGTAPMRVNQGWPYRKVVKLHQNVLVFYKGNSKNIPLNYKDIDISLPFELGEQPSLF